MPHKLLTVSNSCNQTPTIRKQLCVWLGIGDYGDCIGDYVVYCSKGQCTYSPVYKAGLFYRPVLYFLRCSGGWVRGCVWLERADWAQTELRLKTCATRHTPRPDWSLNWLLHHSGDDEERPRVKGKMLAREMCYIFVKFILAGFKKPWGYFYCFVMYCFYFSFNFDHYLFMLAINFLIWPLNTW